MRRPNCLPYITLITLLLVYNIGICQTESAYIDSLQEELSIDLNAIEVSGNFSINQSKNSFLNASNFYLPIKKATNWAGGRNDVTRMVANFAGSQVNSDENNAISIRGNSPTGILWRMNGMPISNPNHFSNFGTNGGPVIALNPNVLSGIDFLTGAFPAEYGNATAGVFDLILKKGDLYEQKKMVQVSAFSGAEFLAEGPIKKGKISYIVSGRKSFLDLAREIGIISDIVPNYADLNFQVYGKHKNHQLALFGVLGTSNLNYKSSESGRDKFTSNLSNIGLKHTLNIGDHYVKTTLGFSNGQSDFLNEDRVPQDNYFYRYNQNTEETLISMNSYLNYQIEENSFLRVGFLSQLHKVGLSSFFSSDSTFSNLLETNFEGQFYSNQVYASSRTTFADDWQVQVGIHLNHNTQNHELNLEPRLYLGYEPWENHTFSIAYGLHSQLQPASVLFFNNKKIAGDSIFTNEQLESTKSHHIVGGYKYDLSEKKLSISVNGFYQSLFDIPVDPTSGSYSLVNYGSDLERDQRPYLINEGTAQTYGIEGTFQKKWSKWNSLLALTFLNSTYKGFDQVERNSAYNLGHIVNFLVGRKINLNERIELMIDGKINWAGGQYYTPIDTESSISQDRTVRRYTFENAQRRPDFFRADLRFGLKMPSKNKARTHQFYIELQNLTNRLNPIRDFYNKDDNRVETINNLGFFLDFTYRVYF